MNNLDTIISNDAWDALSLAEKAEMMRVAVNNGITDLQEIRKQYNEFAEGGSKEGKKVNTIVPFTQRKEVIITPDTEYNQYLNTLPDNQRFTPNDKYDSYLYWKLNGKPNNFNEAIDKGMFTYDHSDKGYHANSIAFDDNTGIGYFMKPKSHDTVGYELDWFNKGLVTEEGGWQRPETFLEWKESKPFRDSYILTDDPNRPNFFKYEPKKTKAIGGNLFGEGGDEEENSMNYEYKGPLVDDDLKRQGITHIGELPEIVVKGTNHRGNYKSAFDPNASIEFINAVTAGGLNNLSPTQWARRAYDTVELINGNMSRGQYIDSWINGNNGIVTDKFAQEHPYWSTGINLAGDVFTLGLGQTIKGGKVYRRMESPKITPENAASITPEQWTAAQDAAIARGDIAEAQRLRDLHFGLSNSKYKGPLFRGTDENSPIMDLFKMQVNDVPAVYLTPYERYARQYGDNVRKLYLNTQNPWIDKFGKDYSRLSIDRVKKSLEKAIQKGDNTKIEKYRGILNDIEGTDAAYRYRMDGVNGDLTKIYEGTPPEILGRDVNKIKSADAVTYDNKGVRIPLGKRDNFNINDIRYGLLPFGIGLGTLGTMYGTNQKALGGNLFDTGGSKDDDLVDWIIREEGFSAKPENIGDGKITLGSGLTNPKWHQLYKKRGNKWSASDNRRAVKEEVANRRRWAEKNVPNWNYLPDSSQKALLSYKYNYDFNKDNSPKLFQALTDHNYTEAARQMDATSKDSKFKKGLKERRKREQKWFLHDFMETIPTASSTTSSTPTIPSFDVIFTEPAVSTNVFNPYVQQVTNTQYVPLMEPASDSYIETVEVTPEEQRRRKLQQVMEAHTRFNNIMELIRPRKEKIPQFIPNNFLDNYNIGYSRGGKIHIKPENRGKFTRLKERTGHSATWFKQHGTPAQKKMATFALNSRHWKHGLGGNLFDDGGKKGFVDNTIDFTYDVDFDKLRVNPETGEVYQQSLPKGAVILPELEVKGKELTAIEKANKLLERLPKEKGLENPVFDPFLMGATAGKLSGDLIGDALGLGFEKFALPMYKAGKTFIEPLTSDGLGKAMNNISSIVKGTRRATELGRKDLLEEISSPWYKERLSNYFSLASEDEINILIKHMKDRIREVPIDYSKSTSQLSDAPGYVVNGTTSPRGPLESYLTDGTPVIDYHRSGLDINIGSNLGKKARSTGYHELQHYLTGNASGTINFPSIKFYHEGPYEPLYYWNSKGNFIVNQGEAWQHAIMDQNEALLPKKNWNYEQVEKYPETYRDLLIDSGKTPEEADAMIKEMLDEADDMFSIQENRAWLKTWYNNNIKHLVKNQNDAAEIEKVLIEHPEILKDRPSKVKFLMDVLRPGSIKDYAKYFAEFLSVLPFALDTKSEN